MLDIFKEVIVHQFEAAFCTLGRCIDRCPEELWNEPVVNLKFCQVAFHAMFFADYYLGENEEVFRSQTFHLENKQFFRNYEELEDRKQELLYDKPSLKKYLDHCRRKAKETLNTETVEILRGPSGFQRRDFCRAELHVVNIRHLQHHAAQLSLRLRIDTGEDVPWFGSGWHDV